MRGPLKLILDRIAARVSTRRPASRAVAGTALDASSVLLLWVRVQGVVVVTVSSNADRIRRQGAALVSSSAKKCSRYPSGVVSDVNREYGRSEAEVCKPPGR